MSLIRRSVISRRNEGKRNKKGGFTLIELTVVLAIMAIILTVIAPNFSSVKDSAKTKVDQPYFATCPYFLRISKDII